MKKDKNIPITTITDEQAIINRTHNVNPEVLEKTLKILCSDHISYERLPMLEVVIDRLIRYMSTTLRNLTSDNVEVTLNEITASRFGHYISAIKMPTLIGIFKEEHSDNLGLIYPNARLVFSIIDTLLGNRRGKELDVKDRAYTQIEQVLLERTLALVVTDFARAFQPVAAIGFEFKNVETNLNVAAIARRNAAALICKFDIKMEYERGGKLEILIPYVMIDPIKERLAESYMGEKFGRDAIWEKHLSTQLLDASMNIEAVLPTQKMPLGEVMNWKVGSQLLINASPTDSITLKCGGEILGTGKMGQKSGQVSISIEEFYTNKEESS
ncbi:MAG: FliM/FliN family flagellar motor switch protein [Alphaproteobacteria bacterium]|nr:FliM/FliN family flagellar motor switch protein [Alphaproteobacteria bacterium]